MRPNLPIVKLCGVVALLVTSTHQTAAQEKLLSIDIVSFFPIPSSEAHSASVQFILDQSVADDFALGADGVITSASHRAAASSIDSNTENYNPAPESSLAASDITLFGSLIVPECGPSPYTGDQIEQMVTEAAERHDVDISLATAVAYAESRFDRQRNSPTGARGPMQLMPDTAARFGVTDACDAPSNIDGGVRYLSWLTEQFGNPLLVAAAYNAGEGRVQEYGGVPPIHETVSYLATIINFQMGIETSSTEKTPAPVAASGGASGSETNSAAPLSGIIQATKAGEFVAGVMQF